MKKLIITAGILGVFLLAGNTVSAQASAEVSAKIDAMTSAAITAINNETSTTPEQKQKVISRIQAFTTTSKQAADADAIKVYAREYSRIAENYHRITGKELPAVEGGK